MLEFIYGFYRTTIDSFRPNGIKCCNCNSKNQMVVEKSSRIFHVFYIPFIPFRIKNTFLWKSCNNEFELRDLNPENKSYYSEHKSKKGIPFWLLSGPIFILIGIGLFTFNQINNENELLERLKNGNQNKIIEYETENGKYTTMKTIKMSVDSVWLYENQFEIEKYSQIGRITSENNYSSDTTKISVTNLIKCLEKGKIKAIYRSK